MTNQQIINALDAFNAVGEKDMPIELTFRVLENIETLQSAYAPYVKALEKLRQKYDEESPEFMTEVSKLLEIDVELKLKTFTQDELVSAGISISPKDLLALRPLIEEADDG